MDLIIRPAAPEQFACIPGSTKPKKSWSLQLRDHGPVETEYRTLCYLTDEDAFAVSDAGAPYFLFGNPREEKRPMRTILVLCDDLRRGFAYAQFLELQRTGSFTFEDSSGDIKYTIRSPHSQLCGLRVDEIQLLGDMHLPANLSARIKTDGVLRTVSF